MIKFNANSIKDILNSKEYDFLKTNENLQENIVLIGLGGSLAYGTNNEDSDIDIRGVATNTKRNILIGNDFEQVVDDKTDTTIYSFDKIVKLLCSCNPNTVEILGLKPEHYLYLNDIGRILIDNKEIFLSKKAIYSFGGYANSQLRRLENKAARLVNQTQREEGILKSIEYASIDFENRFFTIPEDSIRLYVDKSPREDYESEIFCDINLSRYPLRDYSGMFNAISEIVKSYSKIGKRNEKAIRRDKLGKHMMHLVRLYLMCFDIVEKGEINTYRDKEHDFLMDIRNGKYLDENRQPIKEFYEIVSEYENKLECLKSSTYLPEEVDMKKVMDLVQDINEKVVYSAI